MSTQTKILRILSRKQICRNLRIFGVNFELEFFCVKKLTLCNSVWGKHQKIVIQNPSVQDMNFRWLDYAD